MFLDSKPYIVMAVSTTKTCLLALHIAVFAAVIEVSCSQIVTVTIVPEVILSDNGTAQTISCSFSVTGMGYNLRDVQWLKEPNVLIADFFGGVPDPRHLNPDYPASDYPVTRTDSSTDLTINAVRYDKDEGTYSCRVDYSQGATIVTNTSSTEFKVYVLPVENTLSNATHEFTKGETLHFQKEDRATFICEVQNVKPEANFTWTVDDTPMDPANPLPTPAMNDNGLYTSRSTFELVAKVDQKKLECRASNKPGDSGISTFVNLNVEAATTTPPPPTTPPKSTDDGSAGTTETSDDGGFPTWAIIVIVIVVLVLFCIVGVITYCVCKKKDKGDRPTEMQQTKPDKTEEKSRLEKNGSDLT